MHTLSGGEASASNQRPQLGLPEMDEQHRYLYQVFDYLLMPSVKADTRATKRVLDEIERAVLFHFASEQDLMRRYAFPGFAVHQSDHEAAESRIVDFLDDVETGRFDAGALHYFLTTWLAEHSLISDSEYVAWIKQRRAEVVNPSMQWPPSR